MSHSSDKINAPRPRQEFTFPMPENEAFSAFVLATGYHHPPTGGNAYPLPEPGSMFASHLSAADQVAMHLLLGMYHVPGLSPEEAVKKAFDCAEAFLLESARRAVQAHAINREAMLTLAIPLPAAPAADAAADVESAPAAETDAAVAADTVNEELRRIAGGATHPEAGA